MDEGATHGRSSKFELDLRIKVIVTNSGGSPQITRPLNHSRGDQIPWKRDSGSSPPHPSYWIHQADRPIFVIRSVIEFTHNFQP